ncbi:hypothetical protein F8S20_04510 [Nostoc sp. BAE]|nr:hypothetical protein [Nostoc commune BAE]
MKKNSEVRIQESEPILRQAQYKSVGDSDPRLIAQRQRVRLPREASYALAYRRERLEDHQIENLVGVLNPVIQTLVALKRLPLGEDSLSATRTEYPTEF